MSNFSQYSEPKRLNPLTLAYRLLTNFPALLLPLYFALNQGKTDELFYVFILIFIFFITLPSILLNYYFFKFQITNKELVISSGIIAKKQKNIPIRRIQNINMEQNFLQRILGITKVQIETAGEATAEGVLEFVSKADAAEIANAIRFYQEEEKSSVENEKSNLLSNLDNRNGITESDTDSSKIIFDMSIPKVLQFGMLRFRPVALILGGWLFSFLQQFLPYGFTEEIIDENFGFIETLDGFNLVMFAIVAVFTILVSSWLMDIILTFNQFYGFKLQKDNNKFITNYGLFTKRQITIPLKKLQSIIISTNPLKKLINYYTLTLQTAGMGASQIKNAVAVPFATKEEVESLSMRIKNFDFPQEFLKVSKKTIRRALFRYFMFFIPILVSTYFITTDALWLLLLIPIFIIGAILRWQYRGYAFSGDSIYVKQGFWFQKTTIVPIEKIQTIIVKESFFQRRLGLASVHIDTAASIYTSDCSIMDIDKFDADKISEMLIDEFKKIQKNKN